MKKNQQKNPVRPQRNGFQTAMSGILKTAVITLVGLFFSTISAQSQTSLPEGHPIKVSAPHLPKMERTTADGDKFYGEKYAYKADIEAAMKKWVAEYPAEVAAYKVAITKYLKETDIEALSNEQKEIYSDLKSQWLLASQLVN